MRLLDADDEGIWPRKALFYDEIDVLESMLRMNELPEAGVARGLRVDGIDHGGDGGLNDQQLMTATSSYE